MSETSDASRQPLMLIVEDRDVMRAMLHEFVQNAFPACAILDAATGGHAMKLCAEHRPDLVLMDVNLPGINGLDATRQILSNQSDSVVVLLLSTYEEEEYAPRAAECGAAAYIPKAVFGPDRLESAWSAASGTDSASTAS